MLEAPSPRLLGELQALLGPRGFTAEREAMMPSLTDWRGRYRGQAAAMLSPATAQEVQAIVARCAAERVALVPQGGNTSMVGGATPHAEGGALLLSLRRMNAIRLVSQEDNLLVAEAGAILSDVHDAAAAASRRFPLSLGAKGSATVGGLVSTNAGGTQVLRFGPMRALVLGLEAVLPDGSLFEGLSALRKDNRGYDVKQLLIGAEGTLGIVTAASLRLVPAAGSTATAWVGLASPQAALALLRRAEERLGEAVETFELVPADVLDLVLARIPGTRRPLGEEHPWNVLIETTGRPGAAPAAEVLEAFLAAELEAGRIGDAFPAASEAQAQDLWRIRDSIAEAERHAGPSLKHDVSVPVAAMPDFMVSAAETVRARYPGTQVIAFGHLGDGNVHFNVQAPADTAGWTEAKGPEVTVLVHDLVTAAGGSISAEHGIGQAKRGELARTADPSRLAVLKAVKAALDPSGIMNPGKLL